MCNPKVLPKAQEKVSIGSFWGSFPLATSVFFSAAKAASERDGGGGKVNFCKAAARSKASVIYKNCGSGFVGRAAALPAGEATP